MLSYRSKRVLILTDADLLIKRKKKINKLNQLNQQNKTKGKV